MLAFVISDPIPANLTRILQKQLTIYHLNCLKVSYQVYLLSQHNLGFIRKKFKEKTSSKEKPTLPDQLLYDPNNKSAEKMKKNIFNTYAKPSSQTIPEKELNSSVVQRRTLCLHANLNKKIRFLESVTKTNKNISAHTFNISTGLHSTAEAPPDAHASPKFKKKVEGSAIRHKIFCYKSLYSNILNKNASEGHLRTVLRVYMGHRNNLDHVKWFKRRSVA